jgi:hypothetical protein
MVVLVFLIRVGMLGVAMIILFGVFVTGMVIVRIMRIAMGLLRPFRILFVLFNSPHPDRFATLHRVVTLGTGKDVFLVGSESLHP